MALIHIVHALTFDRIIQYKEVSFYSPDVPIEMNGYRIAFVADTHNISEKVLTGVAEELNGRQIDLLILGGDFSPYGNEPRQSIEILSRTVTTDGIFGVEGNHDNYIDLFAAMEEHSVTPLSNSGIYIRDKFYLAGVEDLWNRSPCIESATEGSNPGDFILLISHNPDVTMQQDTSNISLVLSGHTHGGQITFFGIWAPYFTIRKSITDYGQRFASGWASSLDGTPVYVSNGTAIRYFHVPRVFAKPQVILITLHNESKER